MISFKFYQSIKSTKVKIKSLLLKGQTILWSGFKISINLMFYSCQILESWKNYWWACWLAFKYGKVQHVWAVSLTFIENLMKVNVLRLIYLNCCLIFLVSYWHYTGLGKCFVQKLQKNVVNYKIRKGEKQGITNSVNKLKSRLYMPRCVFTSVFYGTSHVQFLLDF